MPAFLCGRKKPLSKKEYKELSQRVTTAHKKWEKLRAKYPGKTTREILELEKATPHKAH